MSAHLQGTLFGVGEGLSAFTAVICWGACRFVVRRRDGLLLSHWHAYS